MDWGYVYVSGGVFDIYVQVSSYMNMAPMCQIAGGGYFDPSISDTGSTSAPSGFTAFSKQLRFKWGGGETMNVRDTGVYVNTTGSAQGISFNGGADWLNDYDEGTWTITNAGDATGVIAANAYGYYLKIGDLVYVQGVFQVTTSFTSATIGGLPYNPKNENTIVSSLHSLGLVRCSNIVRYVQCSNGSSTLSFMNDDGTARPPLTSTDPFRFSITYRAA